MTVSASAYMYYRPRAFSALFSPFFFEYVLLLRDSFLDDVAAAAAAAAAGSC
jgi:hypothetical protein